jgi:tRNA modification GTPase
LGHRLRDGPDYRLSAKTGSGMGDFIGVLEARVAEMCSFTEPAILIRPRHEQAMRTCVSNLEAALDSPPERIELVAERLRGAAQALGMVTGAIGVEDVLDSIFREFCIGK